jgi:hypothetical protein
VSPHPDTRSVSTQVLSGLKISGVFTAMLVMSLFFLHFIPVNRIEAFCWHARHSSSVEVGSYRFPVPKQWYVDRYSANDVMLVDLNSGDGISVRTSLVPSRSTLPAWEALISRPMRDGSTKILGRREFQVSGETILCIEKNLDTKAVHLYPIECRSENSLEVFFLPYLFSAKDHDQTFYSLLKQVQKL